MTFCLLSLLVILPLHPVGALAMTLCLLSLLAFLPLLPRRFCLLIFPHLLLPRRFSRLISPLAFSLLGTQLLQRLRHPVAHGGGAAVDTFTLNVTIPPNVKATVHVPSEHAAHVREPGRRCAPPAQLYQYGARGGVADRAQRRRAQLGGP